MSRTLLVAALASVLALAPNGVHAQTGPTLQLAAGWNMVGGPAGSSFSSAKYLYTYGPGGYALTQNGTVTTCQGLWAYYTAATTVTLAAGSTGPSQTCPLQAGWNLVGNPFAGIAVLPPGTIAFRWDPVAGQYTSVTQIPVGGSVWVYTDIPTSITLQYVPPTATTLTISTLSSSGPYQIHVGDAITLLVPAADPHLATADPHYLRLESAGESGPLSCIGDPSCALTLLNNFWTWRAIAPGKTYIDVAPICSRANPPCATPILAIEVDILP